MNKNIIAAVIFMIAFVTGCATVDKGRFSVVDLDLRTPEQVLAQKDEKTVIYTGEETNKVAQVSAEPRSFPFEILFKFLEVMKGRIMILSLEWKTNE